MGEPKPSLCLLCGNHILPWTIVLLSDGYYLCRPCPKSECTYMVTELVFRDDGGLGYWNGEYL